MLLVKLTRQILYHAQDKRLLSQAGMCPLCLLVTKYIVYRVLHDAFGEIDKMDISLLGHAQDT